MMSNSNAPSRDQLQMAMVRLLSNRDFRLYLDHLKAQRENFAMAAATMPEPVAAIYRAQGGYSALAAEIDRLEKVHDVRGSRANKKFTP